MNLSGEGKLTATIVDVGSPSSNVLSGSQVNVAGSAASIEATSVHMNRGATIKTTSGGVVKASADAAIDGIVDVHGGRMLIGDAEALAAAPIGPVAVGPNGTLRGSGTIQGNLFGSDFGHVTGKKKATLAFGHSPGLMTVEGNVTLEAGTRLEIEIGGAAPGTEYDQLIAMGTINVQGELALSDREFRRRLPAAQYRRLVCIP